MFQIFRDRSEAGTRLAARLEKFRYQDLVVAALPRGGVPVAYEVAKYLRAPLDVVGVRKVGAPGRPELGVGAVGEDGIVFLDEVMIAQLGLTRDALSPAVERETDEIERRMQSYRGDNPKVPLEGQTVILVDDGVATGGTMRAAIQVVRKQGASRTVVAVPVAGPESLQRLSPETDEIVCVEVSPMIWAVGLAYQQFEQVPDETVRALLDSARSGRRETPTSATEHEVLVQVEGATLNGDLTLPERANGLVLFAHGSGSGRKSRRNRQVARFFQEAGYATLLFDLLSKEEATRDDFTAEYRFDIDLLGKRMTGALDWTNEQENLAQLPKACFGASTGAAAALVTAAERPAEVHAVISRGGRPDLAERWLPRVRVPCLFLVGENDQSVLAIHAEVVDRVSGHTRLVIVHGAGHLFEEPGALDEVGRRATSFLRQHLHAPEIELR